MQRDLSITAPPASAAAVVGEKAPVLAATAVLEEGPKARVTEPVGFDDFVVTKDAVAELRNNNDEQFIKILADPKADNSLRANATLVLEHSSHPGAGEALRSAARDADPGVRLAAENALAGIRNRNNPFPEVDDVQERSKSYLSFATERQLMWNLADHQAPNFLRGVAASGLEYAQSPRALEALNKASGNDPDPLIREIAKESATNLAARLGMSDEG